MSRSGTVYLLHFDPPYRHARHYLGWTMAPAVEVRVEAHLNGHGSALVKAAVRTGSKVSIVRTWEGVDRHFERRMKARATTNLCPICTPKPREPRLRGKIKRTY